MQGNNVVRFFCRKCKDHLPVTPAFRHSFIRGKQRCSLKCSHCGGVIKDITIVEMFGYGFDFHDMVRESNVRREKPTEQSLFSEIKVVRREKPKKVSDYQLKKIKEHYVKKSQQKKELMPTLFDLGG